MRIYAWEAMMFLYLFDKVEFDKTGRLCENKFHSLGQVCSNYLYLVSKYNQVLLAEQGMEIPAFFKGELSALLQKVEENPKNFAAAKEEVISNCLPKLVQISVTAKNDKALILRLNELVKDDAELSQKCQAAKNDLQREYLITSAAGKDFSDIIMLLAKPEDKKTKSAIFKKMISYNHKILMAEKVKEASASKSAKAG